uniref:Protein kinase domain-containing protein n=1 Tax=Trieres chinensis TaxID=1514140 RepID=A0A7S2A7P5_TRICV
MTESVPIESSQPVRSPTGEDDWPSDHNSYELLGRIGRGAFASVWRARIKRQDQASGGGVLEEVGASREKGQGERYCAVKVLDLEHVDANFIDTRLEVQTMRLSSHPNVLRCFTSFIQGTNLWLVTQLMDKGSSLRCLQCARSVYRSRSADADLGFESHIMYILRETLLGLRYIHANGQIHRDVKASNVLLSSSGEVRIADFGVSGYLVHFGARRENARTFVGTPCWMAPEVMEQVRGYDYAADIWSLGITALELAKGRAPYARHAPMKVLLLTIQEDPPGLETYDDDDDEYYYHDDEGGGGVGTGGQATFSQSFRAMVKWCLQKDPSRRPSCDELLESKHFRYLNDNGAHDEAGRRMKEEICDPVEDVGSGAGLCGMGTGEDNHAMPGVAPVKIVAPTEGEEGGGERPAGTTWVFSDGSQVLASSQTGVGVNDGGRDDFFDEFERQTQGENFSRKNVSPKKENVKEDDGMDDFFDEFEKTTGGENFRRD